MDLFDLDELEKENKKLSRVKELSFLVKKYQDDYYNGESEISDADFDRLWDELCELDPENPVFKKVGADSSSNFEKASHVMPMGSQEKAANPDQFLEWVKKHNYDEFLVEYKLDGASLELQYENGLLKKAVTRGDGSIGDDITKNARKMKGVKSVLTDPETSETVDFSGGIRGEVIMTHSVHKELYSDKANCRNAANGLMKRKDGEGSENLVLITYDALALEGKSPFSDEEGKIVWLKKMGFETSPLKICKSAEEVIAYRAEITEKRKNLEYDIDGLVIKERRIDLDDAKRARPDRQIAFKFSLEEAVSILREVEWSKNGGTYTPVAIFDEVELNGTKVTRASLANPDTMKNLGVKIGSHVLVVKRGEIIPKIERVVFASGMGAADASERPTVGERGQPDPNESEGGRPIEIPEVCETCGTALVNEGTRLYCPNKDCPKRVLHQLLKWQDVVDIRDFGVTLIENLFNDGRLKSISDIYTLTKEELVPYFLTEESKAKGKESLGAEKVYNSIQSHREVKLTTFLAGFDIEGFGETMAEKLVEAGFDTLDKLISATVDEIAGVYMFAEVSARAFVEGMKENAEEMKYLSENVLKIRENGGGKLSGLSFCFTGELSMKRADAENLVKENGGSIKSSVTKDLSYLVTNDTSSGSSKNVKASKLGIPVIDEKQFMDFLK